MPRNPETMTQLAANSLVGNNSSGSRRLRDQLSLPLVAVGATSLVAGLLVGCVLYAGRSEVHEHHSSGTAAWPAHLVLLVAGLLLVLVVTWRRTRAETVRLLLAPVGKPAAARIARTLRSGSKPTTALRIVAGILPAAIVIYGPLRAGAQVVGGLDPNFTVNAWGGPGYVGAMACHYLDGVWLTALCALLLDKLLLPAD